MSPASPPSRALKMRLSENRLTKATAPIQPKVERPFSISTRVFFDSPRIEAIISWV